MFRISVNYKIQFAIICCCFNKQRKQMLKIKNTKTIQSKKSQIHPIISSVESQMSLSGFSAVTPKTSSTFLALKKQHSNYDQNQNNQLNSNIQQNKNQFSTNSCWSSILSNVSNDSKILQVHGNISRAQDSLINNNKKNQFPCANHRQKQSCYYLINQDNQAVFYCSKCSIMLASQGYIVQRLSNNQSQSRISQMEDSQRLSMKSLKQKNRKNLMKKREDERSNQLTLFLNKIQRCQSKLIQFNQKMGFRKSQIMDTREVWQHKISENFIFLHQIIEMQQKNCLQYLQKMWTQFQDVFQRPNKHIYQLSLEQEDIHHDLNQLKETLQNMKLDICESYEGIVQNATNEQYQTVMEHYSQNIASVQQILNNQSQIIKAINIKKHIFISICEKLTNVIQVQRDLANFFQEFHENICGQIQTF